jgi:hypothetical protein
VRGCIPLYRREPGSRWVRTGYVGRFKLDIVPALFRSDKFLHAARSVRFGKYSCLRPLLISRPAPIGWLWRPSIRKVGSIMRKTNECELGLREWSPNLQYCSHQRCRISSLVESSERHSHFRWTTFHQLNRAIHQSQDHRIGKSLAVSLGRPAACPRKESTLINKQDAFSACFATIRRCSRR